jgi:hypothetical protein
MVRPTLKLLGLCAALLVGFSVAADAQEKRKIHEVQVIKFDNYGTVHGEEKLMDQRYLTDSTGSDPAPVFDAAFSIARFNFPPPNDTLQKTIGRVPTPEYKAAEFDAQKRLTHYYRNAFEHYTFEYNSLGNLQYIKRWGAKHVTAQVTFIYMY